ncbi:MAG: TIGR03016 family PEP-CTERM system-associated outer membrane protein, partial [Betaproteobacteria bacterium]
DSSGAFDSDTDEWLGRIYGATPMANLGWSLEGHGTQVDYSDGRKNESEMYRALMNYRFAPEIRVSASLGSERNDYISGNAQTWRTHGYGFDWSPSERTMLSAFRERRFFGNGHTVTFTHRTPLTSWRVSDTRDVSLAPNNLTTVGLGSIYDLMYNMYQSSIPDPIQREAFVRSLLQRGGIAANSQVLGGFLSSQATVQRQQEISVALLGARNTVTFLASRSENQRLGSTLGSGAGDFAVTSSIRQRGFSMNWAHHLTPLSTLSVMASQQNSAGDANIQSTKLRALTVSYSTKFDPKTTASLGVRRALFESSVNPYQENAITGTLSVIF